MSTRDDLSQNIPGYHIYEPVPGMLIAMYQGVDAVACAAEFPVLYAWAADPASLVAAVAEGQACGKLPRVRAH